MIAENWTIMRTRLEMRFLPILGFAEMKPQALQEAQYSQNCAYRLRSRLLYRKKSHYSPQLRLYILRANCNFAACKILKRTLRLLLIPVAPSKSLYFLQARIVHGFACPTAMIQDLSFPTNRQRFPIFCIPLPRYGGESVIMPSSRMETIFRALAGHIIFPSFL